MNKKEIFKILQILTMVIILLVLGVVLFILWKSIRTDKSSKSEDVIAKFGVLNTPIEENIPNAINSTLKAEVSGLEISDIVYKIDQDSEFFPSNELSESIAEQINLNLSENKDNNLYFTNGNGDTILSYNDNTKIIFLGVFPPITELNTSITNEDEFEEIAKRKLKELNLWPYNNNYSTSYKYYFSSGYEYSETNSADNSNMIGINFKQNVFDIPLFGNDTDDGEIEVVIDSNQRILRISYSYRPINTKNTSNYPLISLDTAISKIENKKGELISSVETEIELKTEEFTINEIDMSYRINFNNQQYLQPVYIFKGIDNNNQSITILVPAIEDTYLQSSN